MRGFYLTFDYHVINIDFYHFSDLILEYLHNQSLVHGPRILKFKGHPFITIGSFWHYECCFLLIRFFHCNLVISSICILKAHLFVARCRIHELINIRKWEVILRACLILVSEVYAYPPFFILFWYDHRIGQSF